MCKSVAAAKVSIPATRNPSPCQNKRSAFELIQKEAKVTTLLIRKMTLPNLLNPSSLTICSRPSEYFLAFLAAPYFKTHADAMAENVLIDLEGGVAHWFDFETVHDTGRPLVWRRADDVRARGARHRRAASVPAGEGPVYARVDLTSVGDSGGRILERVARRNPTSTAAAPPNVTGSRGSN